MRDTLGDHIFDHFLAAKRAEWDSYIRHVSPWEIDRYLNTSTDPQAVALSSST